MTVPARPAHTTVAILEQQLHLTWSLANQVLQDMTDTEALWTPADDSYTVRDETPSGWVADWHEPEPSPAPPASIAWLLWHVTWWWSMVIDHSFGGGTLRRQDVLWPGAEASLRELTELHDRWVELLAELTDDDLGDNGRTRWPYTDGRAFGHVVAWVNVELTKNVAEIGLTRRYVPSGAGGR